MRHQYRRGESNPATTTYCCSVQFSGRVSSQALGAADMLGNQILVTQLLEKMVRMDHGYLRGGVDIMGAFECAAKHGNMTSFTHFSKTLTRDYGTSIVALTRALEVAVRHSNKESVEQILQIDLEGLYISQGGLYKALQTVLGQFTGQESPVPENESHGEVVAQLNDKVRLFTDEPLQHAVITGNEQAVQKSLALGTVPVKLIEYALSHAINNNLLAIARLLCEAWQDAVGQDRIYWQNRARYDNIEIRHCDEARIVSREMLDLITGTLYRNSLPLRGSGVFFCIQKEGTYGDDDYACNPRS
jgi:hypothetical protein